MLDMVSVQDLGRCQGVCPLPQDLDEVFRTKLRKTEQNWKFEQHFASIGLIYNKLFYNKD